MTASVSTVWASRSSRRASRSAVASVRSTPSAADASGPSAADDLLHRHRVDPEMRVVTLVLVVVLLACLLGVLASLLVRVLHAVTELAHLDVVGGLEHGHAVGLGRLDGIGQRLLEIEAVGHHQVRVAELLDVLRRRLVVVGIDAVRHQHLDLGDVAEQIRHHRAEHRVGHHHRRQGSIRALRSGRAVVGRRAARGGQQRHRGEQGHHDTTTTTEHENLRPSGNGNDFQNSEKDSQPATQRDTTR